MGRPLDNTPAPKAQPPADDGRPGRVVVDNRGRNVWQWAKSALDSTTVLLKRLENSELSLEPTQKVPVMPGNSAEKPPQPAKGRPAAKAAAEPPAARKSGAKGPEPVRPGPRRGNDTGGGFDPYNSR
jgi:hypothetical protein